MRSDDLRRSAVWLHRLRFALDETEQLCVHLVFQRRRHSVRRAFVDLERRVLHDLRRQHRGGTDRTPRLTWSGTSSKSARPANDFESCETVSIAESAQCPLVRCPAQLVSREQALLLPGSTSSFRAALRTALSRRSPGRERRWIDCS